MATILAGVFAWAGTVSAAVQPMQAPPFRADQTPAFRLGQASASTTEIKIGLVNLQTVVQESAEGKGLIAKINALAKEKEGAIGVALKSLEENRRKLESSGGLLSEPAARELARTVERQQRELERAQQEAQSDLMRTQREMQAEFFEKKVSPVVQAIAKEKGLELLFSGTDAGLIWWQKATDFTAEVVKRLDDALARAR